MNLDKVVVAVDFSAPSAAAARWVARHFAPGAEVVLVHVIDVPRPPSFLQRLMPAPEELARTVAEGAQVRLRELGDTLAADRVWPVIRVGRPADEIVATAREMGADVIAVGEHSRPHGVLNILGSTAEQVIHSATVPVLLVRGRAEARPARIIAAVDESERARRVQDWVRVLGDRFDAAIAVLYALDPVLYDHLRLIMSDRSAADVRAEAEHEAREWLIARLTASGLDPDRVQVRIAAGDPGDEVLDTARELDADLIVMGSRGAGAVSRTLIGSVAGAVLRAAPCPVLVVTGGGQRPE